MKKLLAATFSILLVITLSKKVFAEDDPDACPKGGTHDWRVKTPTTQECKKCGATTSFSPS